MEREEKRELIEEIKNVVKEHYEIEEGDDFQLESGCYVNGEWLSINNILKIVERAIKEHY